MLGREVDVTGATGKGIEIECSGRFNPEKYPMSCAKFQYLEALVGFGVTHIIHKCQYERYNVALLFGSPLPHGPILSGSFQAGALPGWSVKYI